MQKEFHNKVMQEEDFDTLIFKNNSTKVIRLSNFNENDLQSSQPKRRNSIDDILADDGQKETGTKTLADFLRETSPEDVLGKKAHNIQREGNYPTQKEDILASNGRNEHADYTEQEYIQKANTNSSVVKMKNKPKNAERGVTFSENMHNVHHYEHNDSDSEDQELGSSRKLNQLNNQKTVQVPSDFKPVFASRNSSLKNLKHVSSSSAFGSDLDRSSYQEQFPPPRTNSITQTLRKPVQEQYSDNDSSIISSSVTNGMMPIKVLSPLGSASEKKTLFEDENIIGSSVIPPRNDSSIVRMAAALSSRKNDKNSDVSFAYDDYESPELAEQHYSDILDIQDNISAQSTKNLYEDKLKAAYQEIEDLKQLLANSLKENESLKNQMSDQKQGFDKLSGQAYKKIKELLTDRSVMAIEIKSLKSQVLEINQVEKMEEEYHSEK